MIDPEQEPLESSIPALEESATTWSEERPSVAPLMTTEALPLLPRRDAFPPWSVWDVLAVLGFTVAAILLFSLLALLIGHMVTSKQHVSMSDLATNPIVVIGSQLAAYPVVILFMIALVGGKSDEKFWTAIHWNWPGPATLGFFLSGILFAAVVEFVSRWMPIPKSLPVDKFFSNAAGAYLMAAFGITLAPLLEELFFRGMLYPLLRRTWGVAAGVIVTGGSFACIHGIQLGWAWAPVLAIFVVGVVLTLVRERTDSVAASLLVHCGYNATLFALLWFGSDHFRHLEKVAN
jgi:membrane protease YdiL (CAAX protease family)